MPGILAHKLTAPILALLALLGGGAYVSDNFGSNPRTFVVLQGGTGTTSIPTDGHFLCGDGTGEYGVCEVVEGSNVTIATSTSADGLGTWTISSSGGGASFGQAWELTDATSLAPTTTNIGIITYASSTIGGNLNVDGHLSASSTASIAEHLTLDATASIGTALVDSRLTLTADSGAKIIRLYENSGGEFYDMELTTAGDLEFRNDSDITRLILEDADTTSGALTSSLGIAGFHGLDTSGNPDIDTGIEFFTADQLGIIAGGVEIARATEAGTDEFRIDPNNSGVRFFSNDIATFSDIVFFTGAIDASTTIAADILTLDSTLHAGSGTSTFAGGVQADTLDVGSTASSTFGNGLVIEAGTLKFSGDLCSGKSNGGALTTDTNGHLICEDDDSTAGSGEPGLITDDGLSSSEAFAVASTSALKHYFSDGFVSVASSTIFDLIATRATTTDFEATGLSYLNTQINTGSTTIDSTLTVTGTATFDTPIADASIADTLTVDSSSSVAWTALNTYPTGCTNQFVSDIDDTLTCASVDLANDVTGTLGISNGGTNATAFQNNVLLYFDGTSITATSSQPLYVGSISATTTATSTFSGGVEVLNLAQTGSATSTFNNGIRIEGGTIKFSGDLCAGKDNGGALTTDANGHLICEADDSGAAGGSIGQAWDLFDSVDADYLAPTTTTLNLFSGPTDVTLESLEGANGQLNVFATTTTGNLIVASTSVDHVGNIFWATDEDKADLFTIDTTGGLIATASSTFGGVLNAQDHLSASSTASFAGPVTIADITSAMMITDGTGKITEYGGTSCTNQFPQTQSVLGAWTCSDVTSDDIDTTIAISARQLTIAGTTNQITSSAGAQDLTADRTWTLSIPSLFVIDQASTSQLSAGDRIFVGGTATTTITGDTSTSTFAGGIETDGAIDVNSTSATSTFANGIIVEDGGVQLKNFLSCNLDTDSAGHLVCGADASGGSGDPNVILRDDLTTLMYQASTTGNPWHFPDGFINTASSTITGVFNAENHLSASSTVSIAGPLTVSDLTSAMIITDSIGEFSEYAGTSCTNQFVRSLSVLGAATCADVDLANDITGDLPFANLTQIGAYEILANNTGATADVAGFATSTMFRYPNWEFTTIGGDVFIQPTTTLAIFHNNGLISNASSTIVGDLTTTGLFNLASSSDVTLDASGDLAVNTATTGLAFFDGTDTRLISAIQEHFIVYASSTLVFDGDKLGGGYDTSATTTYIVGRPYQTQTIVYLDCLITSDSGASAGSAYLEIGNGTSSTTVNCVAAGATSYKEVRIEGPAKDTLMIAVGQRVNDPSLFTASYAARIEHDD